MGFGVCGAGVACAWAQDLIRHRLGTANSFNRQLHVAFEPSLRHDTFAFMEGVPIDSYRLTAGRVRDLCERFGALRILVVGDLMLDRFIWGRVGRISPEAPVPVVEVTEESSYPGGAANVARNLRDLGSHAEVLGCVGDDRAGSELQELLVRSGIGTSGVIRDSAALTTVKTRVIARSQQVVRVDRERVSGLGAAAKARALDAARTIIDSVDAVVIEDYAKGFLDGEFADAVLEAAAAHGRIVCVDPSPRSSIVWRGVHCVKPNRSEAFAAAGRHDAEPTSDPAQDAALREVGDVLLSRWDARMILITLGEHGMALFEHGGEPAFSAGVARQVFDVSGAGDTAISAMTLALAAGAEPAEAMRLANLASGVVVGKVGTATVAAQELVEAADAL